MSTDTEAAKTICQLNLQCPEAAESLQVAVREALMPATATRPTDEEYYYNSDDLVLDIDEQFPESAERVVQWQITQRGAASAPPWRPPDFSQPACLWQVARPTQDAGSNQGSQGGRPSPCAVCGSHATALHQHMGSRLSAPAASRPDFGQMAAFSAGS